MRPWRAVSRSIRDTRWSNPPYMMLNPECRVQDGVILLRCPKIEPYAAQAAQRLQSGSCDVGFIVPQDSAPQGGPVSGKCKNKEENYKANAGRDRERE